MQFRAFEAITLMAILLRTAVRDLVGGLVSPTRVGGVTSQSLVCSLTPGDVNGPQQRLTRYKRLIKITYA